MNGPICFMKTVLLTHVNKHCVNGALVRPGLNTARY